MVSTSIIDHEDNQNENNINFQKSCVGATSNHDESHRLKKFHSMSKLVVHTSMKDVRVQLQPEIEYSEYFSALLEKATEKQDNNGRGKRNKVTWYTLRMQLGPEQDWIIERRFSEFRQLKCRLLEVMNPKSNSDCLFCQWMFLGIQKQSFPSRTWKTSPTCQLERQRILEIFVEKLVVWIQMMRQHVVAFPSNSFCNMVSFIRTIEEFLGLGYVQYTEFLHLLHELKANRIC